MKIEALQVGERIDIKKFVQKHKMTLSTEEPYSFSWGEEAHVVMFRYGVVILWNFKEGDKNSFLSQLMPFVVAPLKEMFTEEAYWKKGKKYHVEEEYIESPELSTEERLLISVTLARTIVLDYFESKVESLLLKSREKISRFTKSWALFNSQGRSLLALASEAMLINNATVTQMALMNKPDFIWNDLELDQFYLILEKEYELDDRYSVIQKKLDILLHDSEFIMNYLESQRTNLLELIIIILFIVDIAVIFFEG